MVPGYYEQLGLLSPGEVDIQDEETNINLLFSMGLRRIAHLPYAYLVDKFRWDLYSEKASKARAFRYMQNLRQFMELYYCPGKHELPLVEAEERDPGH